LPQLSKEKVAVGQDPKYREWDKELEGALNSPDPRSATKEVHTGSLATVEEYLNICYYGNEGTGKTTDLAHMAKLGKVMYVNAESGIKRRPIESFGVPLANIELYPDPTSGEPLTFEGMEAVFWAMKRDLENEPGSWAGTVWDSGSEITKLLLEDVTAKRVAKAEKLKRQGKTVSEAMLSPFFRDRDEWGEMSEQVRWLLRRFRDLPCHFGISCLMRRDTDDDGKVHYGPAVNPGIQGDVLGWVDVVCRTTAEVVDGRDAYVGHFRPESKYRGKDRFRGLDEGIPRLMRDPTFDRVLMALRGELPPGEEAQEEDEDNRPRTGRARVPPGRVAVSGRAGRGAAPKSATAPPA
jgi:hypothetical protein